MADFDYRTYRLYDLRRTEMIRIECLCGWESRYGPGYLQRHHRFPSDMLVFDLQFRVRCSHCNRRDGFTISVIDMRSETKMEAIPPKMIVISDERAKNPAGRPPG